ncbi:MAG: ABC transporter permease [Dorea sp.]|jgi:peptide/nickel transport system permease protein|nr:ABC transporter permease [Dorea sp.]MCI9247809.1 ABC transporter permease [Dorea sp.]
MRAEQKETMIKNWYKFSAGGVSVLGLAIVLLIILLAVFAPVIAPYPEDAGAVVKFSESSLAPSMQHLMGTDTMGRDVFSRLLISLRSSLLMGILVLAIAVPVGFVVGVLAGYFKDTWIETVLMRIVDIFLSVPALVLALAIAAILEPNLKNSMIAITIMWWPWYARLSFGVASSLRTENYIVYAELTGAKLSHIVFKEFLPNTFDQILTKMTLDMGYVICMGATLSFVGLGEQPPTPALGNMINDGVKFLPDMWWLAIFPAVTIIIIVLGFNLLGDGVGNIFNVEGK